MILRALETRSFRNLAGQRVEFPDGISVIVGENGQGKTSLLEAIFLLGHLRSFRPARIGDLITWSGSEASVTGFIEGPEGERTIRYDLSSGRRQAFVNDKRVSSASSFFGNVRVIEFTPDDLSLVRGAPESRRHFLDRLLAGIDSGYVDNLVFYQRALRHRNALILEATKSQEPDLQARLESWTELLIRHGSHVARKRIEAIRILSDGFSLIYGAIARRDSEHVSLRYRSTFVSSGEVLPAEELRKRFSEHTRVDLRFRATTLGIHRDDLLLTIDTGHGARRARLIASQGQTRSMVLALKMAATELLRNAADEEPIVLLDDVESELDRTRQGALLSYIQGLESQVFFATTDPDFLSSSLKNRAAFYTVLNGLVSPSAPR